MAVSTAVLRELHRIHGQLSDLNDRLQRGPRQVKAREGQVAQQQGALAAAQEAVKQTKIAGDKKQLDLKAGELKIQDLKAKLNSCSSNKEYQSLLEQISAAEMAGSVLADEILEGMEKIDQLEIAVVEAEQKVAAAQSDLAKWQEIVAAETGVIRGDIARLEGELAEAEKGLPADLKDEYRRVVRGKGVDGLAEVEDSVCQGCGFQITLNMQNDLLLSKPVFCMSCGALLYHSEK
ncbi:MAG: hypothetical protein KDA57_14660 [Planctomycetales bacterium]|nr:hypothetical protein [Planctomycetales bacterium]